MQRKTGEKIRGREERAGEESNNVNNATGFLLFLMTEKPPSSGSTNRAHWKETSQSLRQLHCAIRKSDPSALRNLLTEPDLRLDTSYGGATALQLAVQLDSEEICGILLSSGASANVSADHDDNTLLHQAVRRNQVGVVRVLLEAGADTEASNVDGSTPLSCAAELGLFDVARQLVEAGCNLNRANLKGRSPLISAVLHGQLQIVELLVEAKCDLLSRDNERKNALMVATQANEIDIVRFLISSGRRCSSRWMKYFQRVNHTERQAQEQTDSQTGPTRTHPRPSASCTQCTAPSVSPTYPTHTNLLIEPCRYAPRHAPHI